MYRRGWTAINGDGQLAALHPHDVAVESQWAACAQEVACVAAEIIELGRAAGHGTTCRFRRRSRGPGGDPAARPPSSARYQQLYEEIA